MTDAVYIVFENLRLPVKYISLLSILFPLITGLLYAKGSEQWQRVLFIYIILGFLAEAISLLTINFNRNIFFLTLNLFTICEFTLLFAFYRFVNGYEIDKRAFWLVICLWLLVSVCLLFRGGLYKSNNVITTIEAIILIICAVAFPLLNGFNVRTIILLVDFVILMYFATNFITSKYEREIESDIQLRRCIFTLQRIMNIFFNLVVGIALRAKMKNGIFS